VIGRYAELEELSDQKMVDPHRPYVDDITIPCECGNIMKRVPDIFDVWYDSGVASWATLRFPQQMETFDTYWPAEFILEGQDQTRGLFYSQRVLSMVAFGKTPYKSVLMHGFALDANGKKMSKSLGNVIAPEDVISQFGVDVLRQYILSASAPWDDLRFSMEGVKTTHRMFNVLWNVYRFPLPYMQLDGYTPATTAQDIWDPLAIEDHLVEYGREDRWLVSRMNSLAMQVTKEMEICNLHRVTRSIATFVLDELSRWYVQLVRPRMWLEEDSVSKRQAYNTMYYVLRRLLVILAPFAPYITEEIYQNLRLSGDPESVHMQNWFSGVPRLIDLVLEEEMVIVQEFDEAVANARQNGKRKGRWPVGEVVVATNSPTVANAICTMNDMCCNRANACSVKMVIGIWERVEWMALPVMKAIGKQFGREGIKVRKFIEESDGSMLKAALARDGRITMEMNGFVAELTEEHVMFEEQLPENVFSSLLREGSKVYVDIELTPELESEGYAREVIRRIQEMRKQAGLAVDAKISCEVVVMDERVAELVDRLHDLIACEVRASALVILALQSCGVVDNPLLFIEWNIDGLKVSISIAQIV
jgi:isoleucyl-tRNA synthetase